MKKNNMLVKICNYMLFRNKNKLIKQMEQVFFYTSYE